MLQVAVNGWLEAFAAHPQIGQNPSAKHPSAQLSSFAVYLYISPFKFMFHAC